MEFRSKIKMTIKSLELDLFLTSTKWILHFKSLNKYFHLKLKSESVVFYIQRYMFTPIDWNILSYEDKIYSNL